MLNNTLKYTLASLALSMSAFAQEAAEAGGEAAAQNTTAGFKEIIFGGGAVGIFIWVLILLCSLGMLAFIIDSVLILNREKILPAHLQDAVEDSLNDGDLESAIAACEETPSPLANILLAAFANIAEGYDVIQDSVSSAADLENEKILQRINYLNVFGQMGPMLGLLGTVSGMVGAFAGLANKTGAAKATFLANQISIALWTTVAGLLISIPALLGYTLARNAAIKITIETQSTVLDLIKKLKDAEVDDEEYEDEEYE
ncbi:putative tolQ-type transport protein [Lentisphaera araneosa HTCC2155]|jgi:biopolymer transport protein ExbB|uniref:Putative tolQ-type transport protein n=1 Tax=Lentisphaera araneosa HTCC2155 TaxID=313628 RepID=A6DPI7_9BACT|nr:MotA/TolQ/ExbB proton channel family protein [Lentisphaera araneosa]EDM26483.1 putative tolQ-type transport protein [Lentisphaera araneosa HTCC2155]